MQQADLKLEEAYLSQRLPGAAEYGAYRLHKQYLQFMADGAEAAAVAISHTKAPLHLGERGASFQPQRRRRVRMFSRAILATLACYIFSFIVIESNASAELVPMREACELERARERGCDLPSSYDWDKVAEVECDLDLLAPRGYSK